MQQKRTPTQVTKQIIVSLPHSPVCGPASENVDIPTAEAKRCKPLPTIHFVVQFRPDGFRRWIHLEAAMSDV